MISFIVFFSLILSIYSGLSVSVSYALFCLISIISLRKNIKISLQDRNFLHQYLIFSIYLAIMCLNYHSKTSFYTFSLISLMLLCIPLLEGNTISSRYMLITYYVYLILAFIEILFNGEITNLLRKYFTQNFRPFILDDLNRSMTYGALLLWPVLGYLYKNSKVKSFIFYLVFLNLTAFSDSLASLVSIVLSGLVFILYRFKFIQKVFIPLLIIGSISFLIIFGLININAEIPMTILERLRIWRDLSLYIFAHPFSFILGIGLESSRDIIRDIGILVPLHPHNHILQILYEAGVVGLILYFYFIVNIIKKHHHDRIFISMFVVYYFISLVSYGIWQYWWVGAQIFAYIVYKAIGRDNAVLQTAK